MEEYLHRLRDGQLWGGEVELVVFSKMYRRSIVVFNQQENQVQEQIFYSPEDEAAGIRPEELVHPVSGLRQGGSGLRQGGSCEWPASGGEGSGLRQGGSCEWPASGGEGSGLRQGGSCEWPASGGSGLRQGGSGLRQGGSGLRQGGAVSGLRQGGGEQRDLVHHCLFF